MRSHDLLKIASMMLISLALGTGQVIAVELESDRVEQVRNPDYAAAARLIESGKYEQAIPLLKMAAANEPRNADFQNSLGYAHRKLQHYDAAMTYYMAAIEIKPSHRGANEYLGELYLELGRLAEAEERLKVLDDACFFGCDEYSDLKKAIAAYKMRKGEGS